MNDYLRQDVATFLHEIKEKALFDLKRSNKRYIELCNRKRQILNAINNSLDTCALYTSEEYNDLLSEINAIEQYHLYIQGFRDCIKVYKVIETISYEDIN